MSRKTIQRLSINNQLNPKFLEKTYATDVYVNSSTPGQILPNTTVDFYLPQGDICDLTDCYVQFNMQTVNASAATAEVYTFTLNNPNSAATAIATSGTFRIWIGDSVTAPIAFNASNTAILTALSNMIGFPADIQLVTNPAVSPQPLSRFTIITNTLSTATPGVLSFSINYDSYKLYQNNVPIFLESNLINSTYQLTFVDSSAPNGVLKWPQLDASGSSSVVQQIDITANNVPVTSIQSYARLASIINRQRLVEYETTEASLLYGQAVAPFADIDYRGKYWLPLYGCGLLDKIIPLSLIPGGVFKITVKLDTIANYLVYDSSINPTPSVQFSNFRFYYTRLALTQTTTNEYINRIQSPEGFKLYFRNYESYQMAITGSTEQLVVNPNVSRMTGVWVALQDNTFAQNTLNQFRTSSFINYNISTARLRINSLFYPLDYLTSLKTNSNPNGEYGEFLIEALSAFGQFSTVRDYPGVYHSEILSQNTYTANNHTQVYYQNYVRQFPPSFILAISTNQDIVDRWFDESSVVEVGVNTVNSNNTAVELYGLQISAPGTAYAFIEFVSCVHWKDGTVYYVK